MRSISGEIIFFIVLIAQKYLGKEDLMWGAYKQCRKLVEKLNTTIRFNRSTSW